MEAIEIKSKFHELIDHIDDCDVLEGFYRALDHYHNRNRGIDIIDDLTPQQMSRLNESVRQSEAGNGIPHQTMKAEIKEWLTQ